MDKQYSLRSYIMRTIVCMYGVIFVLLIALTTFSIINYREREVETLTNKYNSKLIQISQIISSQEEYIIDLYTNDAEIKTLKGSAERLNAFNAENKLYDKLTAKMRMDTRMFAFLFKYSNINRYSFSAESINQFSTSSRAGLVNYFKSYSGSLSNGIWNKCVEFEGNVYIITLSKGAKFSLLSMNSLIQEEDRFSDEMERNIAFFIMKDGAFYGLEAARDYLGTDAGYQQELKQLPQGVWNTWSAGQNNGYIYKKECGSSGIYLYSVVSRFVLDTLGWYQILLIVLSLLSALIFVVFFRRLDHMIIRPLHRLSETMNQIKSGHWEVHTDTENLYVELRQVSEALKSLISEIERLTIKSYEEKLLLQKTELVYMQIQLKPHFYLNCLKTAHALLAKKSYDKVEKLILGISAHVRHLLYKKDFMTTVKDELDFVKNYVDLQNCITEREIIVNYDIDHKLLSCELPVLTIQTFVENSIKYGINVNYKDTLILEVSLTLLKIDAERFLALSICDNGIGFSEKALGQLRQKEIADTEGMGLGINNLKRRLAIIYGESVEYDFHNDGRAVSELIIPTRPKNRQGE
ncbi:MAG: histidine kinase [Clostridiales bacterium]|nr:histidine kinase [Clostridiales bacterium]